MNINTIIFDLGGVIIDLNEQATVDAFLTLSGKPLQQIKHLYESSDIFKSHERGLISNNEFRSKLKDLLEISVSDIELDKAWNAMLGEIPIERLKLLNHLKKKFQIFILSNTNDIHETFFTQKVKDVSGKLSLRDFTDQIYYSHELHLRKPDQEIYEKVLQLSQIDPKETLFLDDKKENLLGAESVGIQTMHVSDPNQIFDLEKYV
ncbi:MAG: HAD family phosphatase [Reichenbachiella sp.]